jgi:hypothetical protein
MSSMRANPGQHRDLIAEITRRGWPVTKASYVRALEHPAFPDFPLDAEIWAAVPEDLPGDMPTSLRELLRLTSKGSPAPPPAPKATVLPFPSAERRLDPVLVTSAALRHGFTYEQAEAELKAFGG